MNAEQYCVRCCALTVRRVLLQYRVHNNSIESSMIFWSLASSTSCTFHVSYFNDLILNLRFSIMTIKLTQSQVSQNRQVNAWRKHLVIILFQAFY